MSERPSAPTGGPQASPTASEALAKVLAELRDLTPAASEPEPTFPPRLGRPERSAVRSKKIALEFERDRTPSRRSLKVVAASAVLVAVGAGAMNLGYPMLKGIVAAKGTVTVAATDKPAQALRLASAAPPAQPVAAEPAPAPRPEVAPVAVPAGGPVNATPKSPAGRVAEPVEAASVTTTGAMQTVVATASPVLSRQVIEIPLPAPAPFVAIPSAPPAPPASPIETRASPAPAAPAPQEKPAPGDSRVVAPTAVPERAPSAADAKPEPKPVAASAPASAPASSVNVDLLIRRAGELVEQGDISGARLLLERALSGGSAQAAFALAQTYDPQVLAQWQAVGIRGDPARARELYQLASEKGIPGAKESIASLR